jgi:hypothetical protein
MLQKDRKYREEKMEKWKQNWDNVFMDEVRKEKKVKCHKMFGDKKG